MESVTQKVLIWHILARCLKDRPTSVPDRKTFTQLGQFEIAIASFYCPTLLAEAVEFPADRLLQHNQPTMALFSEGYPCLIY